MNDSQRLGTSGEELAAQFLLATGHRILARNLKSRYGEVDILASRDKTLIIVEVKTKSNYRYGRPADMITAAKKSKLRLLAQTITSQYHYHGPYQIDVITVDASVIPPLIEHYPNAVEG